MKLDGNELVKLKLIWKYVDSKLDYIFPLVFNVISVVNV